MDKSKEERAYEYLRSLIASDSFQPGDLLPTESVISKTLGVNRVTIARALASLKSEGFIERRAGRGTTLLRKPASSTTKLALVILPWPTWSIKYELYFAKLLYAVQTAAIRNGIVTTNLAIHGEQIEEKEFNKIRDIYQSFDYSGAVVIDPFLATHDSLQEFLSNLGCPTVWAGSSQKESPNAYCVDIDDFQAAFDLTEKMLQAGTKNIVYIGFQLNTTARQRRLEGYKAALEKNGLPINERLIICNSISAFNQEDVGRECAGIYAARNLDANAVILGDQLILSGIESFCNELQTPVLKKLQKLPFAVFDYERHDGQTNIQYSVTQPIEKIGEKLVETLISICNEQINVPNLQIVPHEIKAIDSAL